MALSAEAAEDLFDEIDEDGDGMLSMGALRRWLLPGENRHAISVRELKKKVAEPPPRILPWPPCPLHPRMVLPLVLPWS